jgi:alkylated DNA repair dioxygenase AlkB
MGWHADDEKVLGENPVIASISLGGVRRFQWKHKTKSLKEELALEHGSLLLMKGSMQHFWKHQLPKTTKQISPRINLTFRKIYSQQ